MSVGAQVRTATNVREGLLAIDEMVPDIVLTDLAMPGESGLVLLERLRKNGGASANIPAIMLSACAFQADIDASMKAGANAFIAKPFKPSEVTRSVRQLTFQRAMGR
jgi:CheY-like chemotaxis protein